MGHAAQLLRSNRSGADYRRSIINFYDAPRFKVKHTVVTANEPLGENGVYMEVATRDENLHVGVGSHLEAPAEIGMCWAIVCSMPLASKALNSATSVPMKATAWC